MRGGGAAAPQPCTHTLAVSVPPRSMDVVGTKKWMCPEDFLWGLSQQSILLLRGRLKASWACMASRWGDNNES